MQKKNAQKTKRISITEKEKKLHEQADEEIRQNRSEEAKAWADAASYYAQ